LKHPKTVSKENTNNFSPEGWNFDNSYARLPESFYAQLDPVPVSHPRMVLFNSPLAESLGLNAQVLEGDQGVAIFSGNRIPENAQPIAMAYAGHQFGYFTMLGDGRAILLGEHITLDGQRYDIQLKGSGQTPYSRRGDGRAALGPMLREYIISEAMHALGIPTTRSLAAVTTGEPVFRETSLPGAILTRVAASHIRVGTFEYAASPGERENVKILADYTLNRHYRHLKNHENPYLAMLYAVVEKQAFLVAKWQHVGFIHGVMNTDNMALSGETIDYGPCAFMDVYDPSTVFSSIDHQGRYAFGNQPHMAQWNLARLAETLLPLLHDDQKKSIALATEALESFKEKFQVTWLSGMRAKLGLFTEEADDLPLINSLLTCMHMNRADYTITFRELSQEMLPDKPFYRDQAFIEWNEKWQQRLAKQPESIEASREHMLGRNPAVIPRNHRVEEALEAAVEHGNLTKTREMLRVLSRPFDESPGHEKYTAGPEPSDRVYQTFCGT